MYSTTTLQSLYDFKPPALEATSDHQAIESFRSSQSISKNPRTRCHSSARSSMRPSVRLDPFCNMFVRTVADTVTAGPMGPFYAAGMNQIPWIFQSKVSRLQSNRCSPCRTTCNRVWISQICWDYLAQGLDILTLMQRTEIYAITDYNADLSFTAGVVVFYGVWKVQSALMDSTSTLQSLYPPAFGSEECFVSSSISTCIYDADALLFSTSPTMEERPEKSKPEVGQACGTLRYQKSAVEGLWRTRDSEEVGRARCIINTR